MIYNFMYNLTQAVASQATQPLSDAQRTQLTNAEDYLRKHNIHQICNELVAKLIETRPEKVREEMIQILKKMKEKVPYFKKTDFQAMFDSYDVFGDKGNGQVNYANLLQALTLINVHYSQEDFLNKYPQFKLEKGVKKSDFANIMDSEYRKKIQN